MNPRRITMIVVIQLVSLPRIAAADRLDDHKANVAIVDRREERSYIREASLHAINSTEGAVRKKGFGARVRRRSSSKAHEMMEQTEVDGRPVAYHIIGGGAATPLLLINGGPGFDHRFHHLSPAWEELARSRRVIFFDQPGTGQSWQF